MKNFLYISRKYKYNLLKNQAYFLLILLLLRILCKCVAMIKYEPLLNTSLMFLFYDCSYPFCS